MSEKIFKWKKRFGPGMKREISDLQLPDLWHVAWYIIAFFIIIMLSIPLLILAIVSGAVRLLIAVIIVILVGLVIFSYASGSSYNPTRWKEREKEVKPPIGGISETSVCVERAMVGMTYSQQVLRERMRTIMFGKLQRKCGLNEAEIRNLGKNEIMAILRSELLVNFVLAPEKTKKRKWWRKRDRAEWKKIERILKEIQSWE